MRYAVGYLRVSTDGQAEEGYGLEAQRRDIIKYCNENNIYLINWIEDAGYSGSTLERPGIQKLLSGDDVCNPPVEIVVVAKNDRISRDTMDYFFVLHKLKENDIELRSVQEDFGADSMFAPVLQAMSVAFAQMERQLITSRTSSGRKVKASNGGYAGGRPPYGYKVVDKSLVLDYDEARTIKIVFALRNAGYSLREICKQLVKMHIMREDGKPFTACRIKYILEQERFYLGFYKYGGGEWCKGQHTPILQGDWESELRLDNLT